MPEDTMLQIIVNDADIPDVSAYETVLTRHGFDLARPIATLKYAVRDLENQQSRHTIYSQEKCQVVL